MKGTNALLGQQSVHFSPKLERKNREFDAVPTADDLAGDGYRTRQ